MTTKLPRLNDPGRTRWPITVLTLVGLVISCRTAELIPLILANDSLTSSQASLVSVQATGGASAEAIVKSIRLNASDWQLTVRSDGGNPVTLTAGTKKEVADFTLTTLRLDGLTAGKPYELRLSFRFADRDTVTALRTYTHQLGSAPRWTRLAHASFSGGDYTSVPVAVDGICGPNSERNGCGNPAIGAYVGNQVQLLRYPGPNQTQMQTLLYDRATDSWPFFPFTYPGLFPRHQMLQYNLFFQGVDRYRLTEINTRQLKPDFP